MDDLQKLFDWAEDNHYLTKTRNLINAASKQVSAMEAEITAFKKRLAVAEDQLRACLKAEQEQWDEAAVLELIGSIKAFLTHADTGYVAIRREWLEDILWWVEQARKDYEDAATGPPLKRGRGFDPTTLMWPQYYKDLVAALGEKP